MSSMFPCHSDKMTQGSQLTSHLECSVAVVLKGFKECMSEWRGHLKSCPSLLRGTAKNIGQATKEYKGSLIQVCTWFDCIFPIGWDWFAIMTKVSPGTSGTADSAPSFLLAPTSTYCQRRILLSKEVSIVNAEFDCKVLNIATIGDYCPLLLSANIPCILQPPLFPFHSMLGSVIAILNKWHPRTRTRTT